MSILSSNNIVLPIILLLENRSRNLTGAAAIVVVGSSHICTCSHSHFSCHLLVCRSFWVGDGAGMGLELGAGQQCQHSTPVLQVLSCQCASYVVLWYSFWRASCQHKLHLFQHWEFILLCMVEWVIDECPCHLAVCLENLKSFCDAACPSSCSVCHRRETELSPWRSICCLFASLQSWLWALCSD